VETLVLIPRMPSVEPTQTPRGGNDHRNSGVPQIHVHRAPLGVDRDPRCHSPTAALSVSAACFLLHSRNIRQLTVQQR
jgi:hypothetical protein